MMTRSFITITCAALLLIALHLLVLRISFSEISVSIVLLFDLALAAIMSVGTRFVGKSKGDRADQFVNRFLIVTTLQILFTVASMLYLVVIFPKERIVLILGLLLFFVLLLAVQTVLFLRLTRKNTLKD